MGGRGQGMTEPSGGEEKGTVQWWCLGSCKPIAVTVARHRQTPPVHQIFHFTQKEVLIRGKSRLYLPTLDEYSYCLDA